MKFWTYFLSLPIVLCPLFIFNSTSLAEDTTHTGESLSGTTTITVRHIKRKNNILTVSGLASCSSEPCHTVSFYNAFLLDEELGVKYLPIAAGSRYLASSERIRPKANGAPVHFWGKFSAPPEEVSTIDVYFDQFLPIEAVAISAN